MPGDPLFSMLLLRVWTWEKYLSWEGNSHGLIDNIIQLMRSLIGSWLALNGRKIPLVSVKALTTPYWFGGACFFGKQFFSFELAWLKQEGFFWIVAMEWNMITRGDNPIEVCKIKFDTSDNTSVVGQTNWVALTELRKNIYLILLTYLIFRPKQLLFPTMKGSLCAMFKMSSPSWGGRRGAKGEG
jgi:hypothetical protein